MSESDLLEAIPAGGPVAADVDKAAALLEEAVANGCQEPGVLALLAVASKRGGRTAEAGTALRRIAKPGPDVYTQLGLLALAERQPARAEPDLARAWQLDPGRFSTGYNLLMTRLSLGRLADSADLAERVAERAPTESERRHLNLLASWLRCCDGDPSVSRDSPLAGCSAEEDRRLIVLARSLGQVEVSLVLLGALVGARPDSAAAREAHLEVALVRAKSLLDRAEHAAAESMLMPLVQTPVARTTGAALFNLLGVCAALGQEPETALGRFQKAARLAPSDARIQQNLALTQEILLGDLAKAEPHWNRYLDLMDRPLPAPPDQPGYQTRLKFEAYSRLAARFADREKWPTSLLYLQKANALQPDHVPTVEKLFQVYNQVKRPQEARRWLGRLRQLKPGELQYDLFELDLIEVRRLGDAEHLLIELERIRRRHFGDLRVDERVVSIVGNLLPFLASLFNQLGDQVNKVLRQVRSLPGHQVNWSAVRDVADDVERDLRKMRRITGQCLLLVTREDQRKAILDLADQIDRKIDLCRSLDR
jgi:tetratricopeptide (TPR) repeat protein